MSVPMLDLAPQHAPLKAEIAEAVGALIDSGRFVLGGAVSDFEASLGRHIGSGSVVGVSSGTDALLAALMAVGVGAGDEVVTTPFTFIATASCVVRLGAVLRFVDIESDTFNIDPARIAEAVGPKTRAVIAVHLYGHPCDMASVCAVGREHGLTVIEDAAQAIGAEQGSKPVGVWGDVACFSFYPTKNLSAMGDAGACVTRSDEMAGRLRRLRQHGEVSRYRHGEVGGNFRLDAIQAAVLSVKLPHLDAWNAQRRATADRYGRLLEGLPLRLPIEREGCKHVYHQYTVRVDADDRAALMEYLAGRGIGHEVYYPVPLHLQPCFEGMGYRLGDFPVAERAAREVLSLPVYPGLSEAQQDRVVAGIREFYQ